MDKAYWEEKIKMMIQDYNPKMYRRERKAGTLKELISKMAELAEKQYQENLNWLTEHNTAEMMYETQNPTPNQISSAEWMNQHTAKEMVEETIQNLLREDG